MTQEKLFELLEKSLSYAGVVYTQSIYSTNMENFDNNFVLEYNNADIPDDSLLFFVPAISSNGSSKLTIRVPYTVAGQAQPLYRNVEYDILVETNDGMHRDVTEGDIIAFRMCIFRFRKGTNKIILCNSPLYNDALFSNIKVTNATFINKPELVNPDNVNEKIVFVTDKELSLLQARVKALEDKIIFGVQEPDEVLSSAPVGTVYIKVEEN